MPPPGEENSYSMSLEVSKEFGKAMLSAYNWKEIWKLHAGDFLLEELSQEPEPDHNAVIPDPLTVLAPTTQNVPSKDTNSTKKFGDLETFDA
jgi:hypothetical protein